MNIIQIQHFLLYPPTHEPQSPAPGDPSVLSKWALINTDESETCESTEDILPQKQRNYAMVSAEIAAN